MRNLKTFENYNEGLKDTWLYKPVEPGKKRRSVGQKMKDYFYKMPPEPKTEIMKFDEELKKVLTSIKSRIAEAMLEVEGNEEFKYPITNAKFVDENNISFVDCNTKEEKTMRIAKFARTLIDGHRRFTNKAFEIFKNKYTYEVKGEDMDDMDIFEN